MKSGTVHDSANRERISSKHITNAIARMLTTSEVDDMGLHRNQCEKAVFRQPKGWECQGRRGAVKAVTKATHISRTKATTVRIPKVTRTRREGR